MIGAFSIRRSAHTSPENAPERGNAGFTLFETLIVLAITALVLAVSMPVLKNALPRRTLESEAHQIAALMRYARIRAISSNQDVDVAIDLDKRRVQVAGAGRAVSLASSVHMQVLTARGLALEEAASIRFTPVGGATGGRIELSDGTIKAQILVSWLTGDVRTLIEPIR